MSYAKNVGLFGHTQSGKTQLADAILFCAKENNRFGKVDDETSLMDYEPEEQRRRITLKPSFNNFTLNKIKVNIVDTPGESNFFTDGRFAMKAVDSLIIPIDCVDGIRIQSEKALELAEDSKLPVIFFLNKIDKERADFETMTAEIKGNIIKTLPVQFPIGKEAAFNGLVDLLSMKAFIYKTDESGDFEEKEIPEDLKAKAQEERSKMLESIAETDEKLVDKYLESGELSEEEIDQGLRNAILTNQLIPMLCGSALKNIGIKQLMAFVTNYMPDPDFKKEIQVKSEKDEDVTLKLSPEAPFCAFIFKTLVDPFAGRLNMARILSGKIDGTTTAYNPITRSSERLSTILELKGSKQKVLTAAGAGDIVAFAKLKNTSTGHSLCEEKTNYIFESPKVPAGMMSFAIKPKSKGDEEKISGGLAKLKDEDLGLTTSRDPQTNEVLLTGMGQMHIEVTIEKLKRKYGVEVELQTPKVPYKETIKAKANAQGKYKRQSGGKGQYGDTWIELAPLPRGKGFEFVDKIVGGAIPRNYIPSVEKGILESMINGALAGFPVVDLKATLYDGSFHDVDSSDMAFKIAASQGFKKAMQSAKPILLEPVMILEVTVPDSNMGDVIGDLNSRRGKVLGMDQKGAYQIIKATVPMAELLKYSPDLTSMTAGKGNFTMEFTSYEEVPAFLSEKIVLANKKQPEEEKE